MNTTPVACFKSQTVANDAAHHLEENQIGSALVVEAHEAQSDVFVLKVPRKNISEAVDSLLTFFSENEKLSNGAFACPSCGSHYVDYPAVPRQAITSHLVERLAEIVHAKQKTFYCRKCNYIWT